MNMRWRPAQGMRQVLDLVRSGQLSEATALIRGGGATVRPEHSARPRPAGGTGTPAPESMARGTFSCGAGQRAYALYLPKGAGRLRGLVVMLHGCTQDAGDFARGTQMNQLAGLQGFGVLYPEQNRSANPMACWNWFAPEHQTADGGEPAILSAMIADIGTRHGVPLGAVAVAGLSAGGAMAAILGHTHPQLFAAVGIHSGLPVGAAGSVPEAFSAMKSGTAVRSDPFRVPTIVFQGQADTTVAPLNGEALAHGVGRGPKEVGQGAGGRRYVREIGPHGEVWRIDDLGHAWSGGSAEGSYADPVGPDASAEILRFFQEARKGL